MTKLSKLLDELKRWLDRFFMYGPPHTLDLLRIAFGIVSCIFVLYRLPLVEDMYTNDGLVSSIAARTAWGDAGVSLLTDVADLKTTKLFFYCVLVSSLFLSFGFLTKISKVVTCLGIMSIEARNPFIVTGGTILLRSVLIFLMFAKVGTTFSIDRYLLGLAGHKKPLESVALWPRNMVLLQIAIMYGSALIAKFCDVRWMDGTAVYYYFANHTARTSNWVPDFLFQPPFSNFLTYSTLVIEFVLFVSVFRPNLRKYAVPLGIVLHLSISYVQYIGFFTIVVLFSYVSFVDVDRFSKSPSKY